MDKILLLADDDSDDADMFREVLSLIDPDIHFIRCWDGKEVFDRLAYKNQDLPRIIFLDINMPGMNGWQCLAKLKNSELYRDIPVVMYSTSTHKRDGEIALDLGALCFITKPTDFSILRKILETITDSMDDNLPEVIREMCRNKDIKCYMGNGNRQHSSNFSLGQN